LEVAALGLDDGALVVAVGQHIVGDVLLGTLLKVCLKPSFVFL
jgi:hypothetical protein